MPLWGNRDFTSGNNKPLYANTSNVYGIDTSESIAANNAFKRTTPGWVEVTRGRGYVRGVAIANAGANITSAGFVTINGGGAYTPANISYTVNTTTNTVNSVTLVSGGDGYLNVANAIVANTGVGYPARIELIMGGRFGRNVTETLVVIKSMVGDSDGSTIANT
jgi:hypothetical protein